MTTPENAILIKAEDAQPADVAMDVCLDVLCRILSHAAGDVENSALDLSSGFRALAGAAGKQGEVLDHLVNTVSRLEHKDQSIPLQDFCRMMERHITDTVDKIVTISESAMTLAFAMEGAIEQVARVEKALKRVHHINAQTRMLALNATIEAARAGEAGAGFSVVAKEVKHVSKEIEEMSREMQAHIGDIGHTLRSGQETLGSVASIDLSQNIIMRQELDGLMQALLRQNESISRIVHQSSGAVKDISSQINRITVSVQFQDRNSQVAQNAVGLLQNIRAYQSGALPPPEDPLNAVNAFCSAVTLSAIRQQIFEAAAARGIAVPQEQDNVPPPEDTVELF